VGRLTGVHEVSAKLVASRARGVAFVVLPGGISTIFVRPLDGAVRHRSR